MRIDAERLYLRPLDDADCTNDYVAWLNDDQVNRYLETRHEAQNIESVRAFVHGVNARSNEHLFGIFLKHGDCHIGNIKAGPFNAYHSLADVSLFIGARDCWGKGYATEAIRAITRHAFEAMDARKLSAGIYAPNTGSIRAFLRAGYKQEGLRRSHYLLEGVPCDVVELGRLREDA